MLDFPLPNEAGQDLYAVGPREAPANLGDQHVARSLAGVNDFNRDFQEFITRCGWGTIWTRPGLDDHTRSLSRWLLPGPWGAGRSFVSTCVRESRVADHSRAT